MTHPSMRTSDPGAVSGGLVAAIAAGVVVLLVAAGAAGALVGRSQGSGSTTAAGASGAAAVLPTARPTPSATSGAPAPSTTPSAVPTASATPAPAAAAPVSQVEKGRVHDFGFLRSAVVKDGHVHLGFDRATLLRGKAADDWAKAHGQLSPVPNDYVIVNDAPALRDLVLATTVVITGTGHLADGSTDPAPVTVAQLVAALRTDHDVPVDVTYDTHRRVVRISEPFFP